MATEQRPGRAATERMSVAEFCQAIRERRLLAGDAVLYCWGRQNPLSLAIAHVQRRALRDLLRGSACLDEAGEGRGLIEAAPTMAARIAAAAVWTHAGIVVDAELSAEMTAPRARLIAWSRRLRVGDRLLVVRPLPCRNLVNKLYVAAAEVVEQAAYRVTYPWRELLTYWFHSVPNAIAAKHWAEYFKDHERNVCSGAIWEAWQAAGCLDDSSLSQYPESWYPGRMAIDTKYLQRIAEVVIVEAGKGDGDEK